MIFSEKEVNTKDGRIAILRNANKKDASTLIAYMKSIASETSYLTREPEEINITLEQEEMFITKQLDSERELMLVATINGKHVGNCSMSIVEPYHRYQHRCRIGIALYQEYCGIGLGRQMLLTVLEQAKLCGYEQAELEVVVGNERAFALYDRLGFEVYGTLKNATKYKDGSYSDSYLMVKYFKKD